MNINRTLTFGMALVFLLTSALGTAWADRGHRDNRHYSKHRHIEKRHVAKHYKRHHRHAPRYGHVVKTLPPRYRSYRHYRTPYYYASGLWYRSSGLHFSIVAPPVGLVIPVLPPFYSTVWRHDEPYYYAAGTYYTWHPRERGYVVTEPPEDLDREVVEVDDELFVYPTLGQNEDQVALDRYECHRWASDQTGYDPSRAGGNVERDDYYASRGDYNRANQACLEARDYSVQ